MHCSRCHGLLVTTFGFDCEGTCTPVQVELWRCVSCGDLLDEQILANRVKQKIELQEAVCHPDIVTRFPLAVDVLHPV